ncbi:MAG TPA: DivIVA domain-containing protein [Thermoleophilaceae bacterium]|nr:DivIVA domain-containing protein [Thermoleophilaceae bacterium]
MDHQDVERIRSASFTEARRGYEKREVDAFLARLADWLESGAITEATSHAVKVKLERAGETTARILATAEGEAQEMRREAEEEAAEMISDAERSARETMEAATRKADRTVREGEDRRRAIEAVIVDLVGRRDEVLSEIDRLGERLRQAYETHTPAGPDPYATPDELDPAERVEATEELPEGQPAT